MVPYFLVLFLFRPLKATHRVGGESASYRVIDAMSGLI